MKKVLFIIAQKDFRDEELFEPKSIIENAHFQTVIVSQQRGPCVGKLGAFVDAQLALSEVIIDDSVAGVVVVGGPGSPALMQEESLGEILRKVREEHIVLGAICYGPAIVASFDVINGMHATVFADEFSLNIFKEHNIAFVDEIVVVDEKLVTANGPSAGSAFAEQLVELM
jgi:protease I